MFKATLSFPTIVPNNNETYSKNSSASNLVIDRVSHIDMISFVVIQNNYIEVEYFTGWYFATCFDILVKTFIDWLRGLVTTVEAQM